MKTNAYSFNRMSRNAKFLLMGSGNLHINIVLMVLLTIAGLGHINCFGKNAE
jgi:putative flippase GtrA